MPKTAKQLITSILTMKKWIKKNYYWEFLHVHALKHMEIGICHYT